ncbi:hypothetical protein [Yoonia sediminilitoris]|uniref:Uncharacterized protein n=1 Tax=Yoonia sediminilitoris TaxID=1286148 RepID=A0A2T6K106_9RHOB|nr:hypothetical protein [Yoonia sediminilitoris]PUB08319.1 hypothetical protein C8N45_1394 [Yoonia sediminilitoris]RCW89423.1 hypothetical protein DFP92_1384 [Yoonia sediminilitoris]
MPDERFQEVLKALSKRLEHLLMREAHLGSASRISGAARLKPDELHGRLERLRDYIPIVCDLSLDSAQACFPVIDFKRLRRCLKPAPKALERKHFKGMHATTLEKKLRLLWGAFEGALEVFEAGMVTLGDTIEPDGMLHLLTPDELEALHSDNATATALAACLRAEAELRNCLQEVRSLVADHFGCLPNPGGGPYEKRRGALIAAHLIGMAVGLGLKPTRAKSSPCLSACDAAVDASFSQKALSDPIARAVREQIPQGYAGMEHIWIHTRTDQKMKSHMEVGHSLGVRAKGNSPKSAS